MKTVRDRNRQGERGAVMVLAAIVLIVLGAFMALAINGGHGVAIKGELQNAADAAALAGARDINGTLTAITTAQNTANNYAGRHFTDPRVPVTAETVEFGNWDPGPKSWTQLTPAPENLYKINAIRVVTSRNSNVAGGPVEAWFGQAFLKKEEFDVSASSIAFAGGPCPDPGGCHSPFVIRYGCLVHGDVNCTSPYYVGLSNAGIDSAGFSDMNPQPDIKGNPSASSQDVCKGLTSTTPTTCTMGDSFVKTTNGSSWSANNCDKTTLCQLIKDKYKPGTEMRVPVVIYDGEKDVLACMDGQYGGVARIITTIKMRVDGIWCKGDSAVGRCNAFAGDICGQLTPQCDDTEPTPGACVPLGTETVAPKLGR